MDFSKYKPLKKGGAKKAAETFSSTRKKHEPSERLIKIISEVQPDRLQHRGLDNTVHS